MKAALPYEGRRYATKRTYCSHAFMLCDLSHLSLRRSGPRYAGAKRRKTMKPSKQIPMRLTIDVAIILVGLAIIAGGIWITNARIFGMPV